MKHKYTTDPTEIDSTVESLYTSIHSFSNELMQAYKCYLRRTLKLEWPEGGTERDHRFHPSDKETCECCKGIRSPSRQYPFTKYKHCLTSLHIANLYKVDLLELRKVIIYYKDEKLAMSKILRNSERREAIEQL